MFSSNALQELMNISFKISTHSFETEQKLWRAHRERFSHYIFKSFGNSCSCNRESFQWELPLCSRCYYWKHCHQVIWSAVAVLLCVGVESPSHAIRADADPLARSATSVVITLADKYTYDCPVEILIYPSGRSTASPDSLTFPPFSSAIF